MGCFLIIRGTNALCVGADQQKTSVREGKRGTLGKKGVSFPFEEEALFRGGRNPVNVRTRYKAFRFNHRARSHADFRRDLIDGHSAVNKVKRCIQVRGTVAAAVKPGKIVRIAHIHPPDGIAARKRISGISGSCKKLSGNIQDFHECFSWIFGITAAIRRAA